MVAIVGIVCLVVGLAIGYLIGQSSSPLFSVLLALAFAGSACGGPLEAAQAAEADARTLSPIIAYQTRYLWTGAVPAQALREQRQAGSFWINSLSVGADVVPPRAVGSGALAVYLPNYGMTAERWEKFADVDPYFTRDFYVPWRGGVYRGDGKYYAPGSFQVTVRQPAPWLANLATLTNSKSPLLRSDWWANQVSQQADRNGTGYYDQLGLGKKRADFEKLVGMDRLLAQRVKKEVAALVQFRGPALNNAQIYRFQTINGSFWETRDSKTSVGKNNALRLLDDDFKHDAEEIYGSLPNGLFAFFLCDAAGNRVDFAPDNIASDGRSVTNDRRIHVGFSCVRCHVEGIRPIDCWFRRVYAAPDALNVLDPARSLRLRQLFASDLDRYIRRDQADYAEALKLTNGLTPGDNAKVIAAVAERYHYPVTLEDLAREMGVDVIALAEAIRMKPGVDPILFGMAKGPARREHVEEIFSLAMEMMGR